MPYSSVLASTPSVSSSSCISSSESLHHITESYQMATCHPSIPILNTPCRWAILTLRANITTHTISIQLTANTIHIMRYIRTIQIRIRMPETDVFICVYSRLKGRGICCRSWAILVIWLGIPYNVLVLRQVSSQADSMALILWIFIWVFYIFPFAIGRRSQMTDDLTGFWHFHYFPLWPLGRLSLCSLARSCLQVPAF